MDPWRGTLESSEPGDGFRGRAVFPSHARVPKKNSKHLPLPNNQTRLLPHTRTTVERKTPLGRSYAKRGKSRRRGKTGVGVNFREKGLQEEKTRGEKQVINSKLGRV